MSAIKLIERSGDQTDAGLMHGINRVSIRTAAHGRPIAVTLWQKTGGGTRIESVMHDLSERIEAGVLLTSRVSIPFGDELFIDTPGEFADGLTLTKLFIEAESYRLESGMVLTGCTGHELVIVAGAYPYSLAVRGLGDSPNRFEPEYPLASYERQEVR